MSHLRPLGSTGISIAPLVVGGNVFGWTVGEADSFDILDAWMAGGATMIDTADIYSSFAPGNVGGESETILGKWMKSRGNRDKVQIATKMGLLPMSDGSTGLTAKVIAEAVDRSLTRLQTDYIDLYYAHSDDAETPQEETARAFDALIRAGKVRSLGASNFSQKRLTSALATSEKEGLARYGALQPHFNLMETQELSPAYRRFCIENNIGVLSYYGLANGFLTGKYRSAEQAKQNRSVRSGFVAEFFNARGEKVLAALDQLSAETGATPGQIALAWNMTTPGVTGTIASATSQAQVETLIPALDLSLSPDQMELLDSAAATPV